MTIYKPMGIPKYAETEYWWFIARVAAFNQRAQRRRWTALRAGRSVTVRKVPR